MSCLNYGFVRNLQKPKVSFVDCLYVYVIKKRYQKSSKMNLVKKNTNSTPILMSQKFIKLILLIFLFHCIQINCFTQNPNPSSSLDAAIQSEMSVRHFPGVSTIIVKNNKIVWVESYGYADIANSLQVEDTTVFLLASVSKLFTGTAAMQLYEAGTVDLDTDINNYLPWTVEIPNFSNDSITIRQLMTHTSSIKDNWGVMSSFYGYPDPTISLANCMESYFPTSGSNYNATGNFINSAPGSSYQYSNMASALNGYIIEASTGVAFDDYCDNNLFNELCMENTAWHFSDFNPDQVAIPYSYQNGNYTPYNHYGFADYPNGQLRSTILDLGNFMIAFLNGGTLGSNSILSPTTVNDMLSFQIPNLDTTQGLNWYRTKLYYSGGEAMLWSHSGGESGVNTNLLIDPSNDVGICVLTNGEGDGLYICDALYDHALSMNFNNSITPCSPTVEISELEDNKEILIYPNPAKDFINIEIDLKEETQYNIYSISGKMVLSGIINSKNRSIKLPNLSAGLYIFKLHNKPAQLLEINN